MFLFFPKLLGFDGGSLSFNAQFMTDKRILLLQPQNLPLACRIPRPSGRGWNSAPSKGTLNCLSPSWVINIKRRIWGDGSGTEKGKTEPTRQKKNHLNFTRKVKYFPFPLRLGRIFHGLFPLEICFGSCWNDIPQEQISCEELGAWWRGRRGINFNLLLSLTPFLTPFPVWSLGIAVIPLQQLHGEAL